MLLAESPKPEWCLKELAGAGDHRRVADRALDFGSWRMVLAFGGRAQGFDRVTGALFWWAEECFGAGWGEVWTVAFGWLV